MYYKNYYSVSIILKEKSELIKIKIINKNNTFNQQ